MPICMHHAARQWRIGTAIYAPRRGGLLKTKKKNENKDASASTLWYLNIAPLR